MNMVTEIAEGHQIADARLKAIASGELTTAEHKHMRPFDFQPFATCWFGTNHMPHARDFSEAPFRRAIIIPFNRTFSEKEQDTRLKDKLKAEMPGILHLALAAIAGVFAWDKFTLTLSGEKAEREWRLNCDQVAQFVEHRCEFKPGEQVLSGEIYTGYLWWADENGIWKTLNRNNFTKRMVRLGAVQARGTGGARYLAGIRLR